MADIELVIKIPEEQYNTIKSDLYNTFSAEMKIWGLGAIRNGIPIPDNVTNGNIIKMIFDTTEEHFYDEDRMVDVYGLDRTDEPSTFYADWWNSPYQKGGKE